MVKSPSVNTGDKGLSLVWEDHTCCGATKLERPQLPRPGWPKLVLLERPQLLKPARPKLVLHERPQLPKPAQPKLVLLERPQLPKPARPKLVLLERPLRQGDCTRESSPACRN